VSFSSEIATSSEKLSSESPILFLMLKALSWALLRFSMMEEEREDL